MYKLGLDDGGLEASRQFCSPVVATPLLEGESCTITGLQESPLGYQDDCEPGFYCDGGLGNRCTMLCRKSEGSDESPLCEFPRRCHTGGVVYDGARCSTPCEPMSAEGDEFCTGLWGEDAVCGLSYLFGGPYAEGLEWETKCNSTGGFPMEAGEPCTATCSNPSLTCAPSELLGGSCAGDACCTQVCDVNEGNAACTEMGHECVPMFPDHLDDPMYGHFGYCGIPS